MRRFLVLLCFFAFAAQAAAAPYTEIPPFPATKFRDQTGEFRWYTGCWWKVVDPQTYLVCRRDGVVYLLLPNGQLVPATLRDIGISGIEGIPNGQSDRDIVYQQFMGRYGSPPPSVIDGYLHKPDYYRALFPRLFGRTPGASGGGYGRGAYGYGSSGYGNNGTGVFRNDSTTGGHFLNITGYTGGTYSNGGSYGGSVSGGGGGVIGGSLGGSTGGSPGGSTGGTGGGSRSSSSRSSTGGGDFINDPIGIHCNSIRDSVDLHIFGPAPCTWYPGVFGPVPHYGPFHD